MPVSELAKRRDLSAQFLEQLFAILRRAGIVNSRRGVKGGYTLARPADSITLLEIVELLDGPPGGSGVQHTPPWDGIVKSLGQQLAGQTLESIAQAEAAATEAPMYYI